MICSFDHHQLLRFRHRGDKGFELSTRSELIAGTADEQLGLAAILEEIEGIDTRFFQACGHGGDWRSDADERANAIVGTRRPQTDGGAEGEPGKDQRQRKLRMEPIERNPNVVNLAVSGVVLALTEPGTAEIEAQHGKPEAVERFHGVEDDLVVQGSAENGMRVADQGSVRSIFCTGIDERFQTSSGTVEKDRPDG